MTLDKLTFYIFVAINAAMIIRWLWDKRCRGYGFPFFAGGIALAMVLPQGIALLKHDYLMPPGSFRLVMIFASLCTVAIWAGFKLGLSCRHCPGLLRNEVLDDDTLYRCALAFTIIGGIFQIWLANTVIQRNESRQWTGLATVLHFFSLYSVVGLMIGMYLYLKNRWRKALILVLVGFWFIVPLVVFHGRRAVTMQLLATLVLPLWFVRKKAMPRLLMLAIIGGMVLVMFITDDFRRVMLSDDYEGMDYVDRLSELDVSDAWVKVIDQNGGGGELLNCVHGVSAAHELGKYDFGLPMWNWVVWSYVPAQFVGRNFKQRLYIDINWPNYQVTRDYYPDYEDMVGSMWLGYTDAFQSYWWLGWIPFFVISWIMGWLYNIAEAGSGAAICLYTWYITPALHIVPAMTYLFWINLVYLLVFCLPIVILCRKINMNKPQPFHGM